MTYEIINAKNFMEFFEKECGIEFVDITTGKKALEMIAEKEKAVSEMQKCGQCKYASKGDGDFIHVDDLICVNDNSPNVSEFVFSDTSCNYWQQNNVCMEVQNDADSF